MYFFFTMILFVRCKDSSNKDPYLQIQTSEYILLPAKRPIQIGYYGWIHFHLVWNWDGYWTYCGHWIWCAPPAKVTKDGCRNSYNVFAIQRSVCNYWVCLLCEELGVNDHLVYLHLSLTEYCSFGILSTIETSLAAVHPLPSRFALLIASSCKTYSN